MEADEEVLEKAVGAILADDEREERDRADCADPDAGQSGPARHGRRPASFRRCRSMP